MKSHTYWASALLVLALALSGDIQGKVVAGLQPAKLAAMESHWETTKNAPFYLAVVPDEANETNSVEAIGIPVAYIGLIVAVDRLFDMGRTCLNVTGDIACSLCVTKWESKKK